MKYLKLCLSIILVNLCTVAISSQYLMTRDGKISFYSEAPMENIEAHNHKVTSVLDTASGEIEFAVLIKAFKFEKALMKEHFNENYMESGKFPKATFKGSITNLENVDFKKDGTYTVKTKGQLTIHGVTQDLNTPATIKIENGNISGTTKFSVKVADYNISIPAVVRENIAKIVDIVVRVPYEHLKKESK